MKVICLAMLFAASALHAQQVQVPNRPQVLRAVAANEIRKALLPNDKPCVFILTANQVPGNCKLTYIENTASTDKSLTQCLTKLADSARMVQGNVIGNVRSITTENGPGLSCAIYYTPQLFTIARSGVPYVVY